ncbi:MAG: hypothetical protein ACOCWC_03920 [Bacteroidota bacterium]
MKRLLSLTLTLLITTLMFTGCEEEAKTEEMGVIPQSTIEATINKIAEDYNADQKPMITKGVSQLAALWKKSDGTEEEFTAFCVENYAGSSDEKKVLFEKLSQNYESIWGYANRTSLDLMRALHLDKGEVLPVDMMFGSYSPLAHFYDDFFKNKIAFLNVLNFPFYSLDEKADLGRDWNRLEWAYARMGDVFTARVPAEINQIASRVSTESDAYISEYNIVMGKLLNEKGETIFPEGMKLITHWGLRDQLKSNYGIEDGLEKQRMIYKVMERIITQEIPEIVINNTEVEWDPYANKVYKDGEEIDFKHEPDTRYKHLLNNYHASREADAYSPRYPTAIERAFDANLELTRKEVEDLFIDLVSSPLLKQVGELITKRLGRDLEAYDIWYDGFKARSGIDESNLDIITQKKYPNAQAFENDIPNILMKLGYKKDRANEIASKITVEAARGAGHAWGAEMRSQNSYLRTRIANEGLNYNGYNIASHELGHNVEQTISLYDVDYYMLNGVPNTAFTEALAFIFQTRDLELLGMESNNPNLEHLKALDVFWGAYEIMGVSLVDMYVWQWMYENPNATEAQLKEQTIKIAKQVWNDYFAPVFGVEDSPILAVYSHMISYPLYLAAYPIGHLIEFQLEGQIAGKNTASEIDRIFATGRLIPQEWMKLAVGEPISNQPLFDAIEVALKHVE